ncbi:MAG: quinone-dependent dihydroorotate dehydrogenase [Actinomycetota bacterium]
MLYRLFFDLVFKKINPESAHHLGMAMIRLLGATGIARLAMLGVRKHPVRAMGLDFDSPFGMAAGFDKNAVAINELGQLGFSHVEIGTVTRFPQDGNQKPRLFRLPLDKALINRMGFNNEGADAIAIRLQKLRESGSKLPIIGVNIGKSRVTDLSEAEADYAYSARVLAPFADYLAVNVSSPNTPGLRSLQSIEALEPILRAVIREAKGKPVLVKIAPDLADEDIRDVAKLAKELNLAGVIATNTTISRENLLTRASEVLSFGEGGLSGPVLKRRSVEVLKILRSELNQDFVVISVGGISSGADLKERLELGANLVQGYTGFIYRGPLWVRNLMKELDQSHRR